MKIRRQAKSGLGERAAKALKKAIRAKFGGADSASASQFAGEARRRLREASHRDRRRIYAEFDRMIAARS